MARRWAAHLVGVYVMFKGATPHPSVAYARSEKAIAGVIAHELRVADACECTTAEVGDHFRALCARLSISLSLGVSAAWSGCGVGALRDSTRAFTSVRVPT